MRLILNVKSSLNSSERKSFRCTTKIWYHDSPNSTNNSRTMHARNQSSKESTLSHSSLSCPSIIPLPISSKSLLPVPIRIRLSIDLDTSVRLSIRLPIDLRSSIDLRCSISMPTQMAIRLRISICQGSRASSAIDNKIHGPSEAAS